MATVLVILQLLGRFFSEIIRVRNIASYFLALGPRFFRNSGWMLSYPGALPHFMFLRAVSTSFGEMGVTVVVVDKCDYKIDTLYLVNHHLVIYATLKTT